MNSASPLMQLDQMRRQMVEELTQIPQYRALKAIERFIGEMSAIYDQPAQEAAVEQARAEVQPTRHEAQPARHEAQPARHEAQPARHEAQTTQSKITQAIENHVRGDGGPAIVKNASYLPVHRVA